jgi:hypothetical protein
MRRLPIPVAADGTNAMLHRTTSRVTLRIVGEDRVRAVVPAGPRVDDEQLCRWILPIIRRHEGVLTSFHLSECRLSLTAAFPQTKGEIALGDVVRSGLEVRNSEVGLEPPSIYQTIERLACLNLATLEQMWGARGASLGDLAQASTDLQIRLALIVRDQATRRRQLRKLRELPLPDRALAATVFARRARLTGIARAATRTAFVSGGQVLPSGEQEPLEATAFGLWNALTAAAQLLDGKEGVRLRKAAGKLLDATFVSELVAAYEAGR